MTETEYLIKTRWKQEGEEWISPFSGLKHSFASAIETMTMIFGKDYIAKSMKGMDHVIKATKGTDEEKAQEENPAA